MESKKMVQRYAKLVCDEVSVELLDAAKYLRVSTLVIGVINKELEKALLAKAQEIEALAATL